MPSKDRMDSEIKKKNQAIHSLLKTHFNLKTQTVREKGLK